MSFIKKYSLLLIPAGIALAAVVVIVLTILTSRSLAKDIAAGSLQQDEQIKRLLRNRLSERQPEVDKTHQDLRTNDALGVKSLATCSTRRELISYRIFLEEERDSSQQVFDEYGQNYRVAIESLVRSMQALEAPTEIDIRKALNESSQTTTARRSYGGYTNPLGNSAAMKGTAKKMLDAICSKRAGEIRVYANRNLFKWYDYWGDFQFAGSKQAVQDCWYSQLAYWIYEDVVDTINKLNTDSQNVSSSPVKRLLGVSFREPVDYPKATGRMGYGLGGSARRSTYGYDDGMYSSRGDAPEYIRYAEGGALDVETWMGRVCNDDIDIVHFSVGVITSSSAVMSFMEELCSAKDHVYRKGNKESGEPTTFQHNQIGILKSEVIAVEREAPDNVNYRYGDEAVVRVDLICEYVFNRAGYDKIKPKSIKEQLGQTKPEDGAAGGATVAPSMGRGMRPPTGSNTPGERRGF